MTLNDASKRSHCCVDTHKPFLKGDTHHVEFDGVSVEEKKMANESDVIIKRNKTERLNTIMNPGDRAFILCPTINLVPLNIMTNRIEFNVENVEICEVVVCKLLKFDHEVSQITGKRYDSYEVQFVNEEIARKFVSENFLDTPLDWKRPFQVHMINRNKIKLLDMYVDEFIVMRDGYQTFIDKLKQICVHVERS